MLKISAWLLHPKMVTRLHLLHSIVVRLHVHKADVVILPMETVGTMVFEQQHILVGRTFYPGRSHGCCPVRATGVVLVAV